MATGSAPTLAFTDDAEANRLIASDANALLIGFALDQQITVQHAFAGPLTLLRRLGDLDPARIAAMEPSELEAAFRERPAVHRYPAAMAGRVQALCGFLAERYAGRGERIWTEAGDAADMRRRILELPGFGEMKATALTAVLVKRLGVRLAGWEQVVPSFPTLGDVDSPEALAQYQAHKRAMKAARRRAG